MFQIDTAMGVAGAVSALAASGALYGSVQIARRRKAPKGRKRPEPLRPDVALLPDGPIEIVPAQMVALKPLPLDETVVVPFVPMSEPAGVVEEPRATVKVRRVAPAGGKPKAPRPIAPVALAEATTSGLTEEQRAELLSLVGALQWDRALACVQGHAGRGLGLAELAAVVEGPALDRLRALPEREVRAGLGGYRLLAMLDPANADYAARVLRFQGALEDRRKDLLAQLTRDEDRFEPGTVWYNHPYNPRFDDVRLPIWLYIGCKEDGQPWFRLRTNWLGESRIAVQGIEVIYDGMTETLTEGAYKIDADALGWEWRDEQATFYQVEVLRSMAGARDVTLRYKGDPYFCEVELAEDEKQAVADMLELYDLMRAAAVAQVPQAEAA
ncbi:hypothetical protein [Rubellimicrobium roseum]|uniref:Uncharacterized protein n=1 Tax=Rubellimicrobium roseum TaxID=687525 RepID=A0A5C4NK05_9RHOB|nr:hypothetical protein [Rubellimicrobium roseum]TNC73007.1 hypothetical protein FHG71_06840 [Rubellimicrobium roseum]